MNDREIENKILNSLSPIDPTWSNQLSRRLRVNKNKYTKIRNKMIDEGWIKAEKKKNRLLLTILNFEEGKFKQHDWTYTTKINCDNWRKYFKDRKPLFTKKKKVRTKDLKYMLDAYFHELDRQMIVCIRFVNAEALGLITSGRARTIQHECIEFVKEYVKKLLNDHKEFKEEIKEYAQSQLRTVQFKI